MIRSLGSRTPVVDPTAYVFPTAEVIGSVELARDVSLWPGAILRGDLEPIRIGPGSNVQDNSVLHTSKDLPVEIGPNVTVGHSVTLHGCKILGQSIIGMGATILDGVVIEEETIIGAGSVVAPKMRIPRGKLALGVPARVVRNLTPAEIAHIQENAQEYVSLIAVYRSTLRP